MVYRYGIKNAYKPTHLAPHSYGYKPGANYDSADVPSQLVTLSQGITEDLMKQQFAYEWFQSGETSVGFPGGGGYSNPPFVSGAAGRLHPSLTDAQGKPARILRGYIRRAEYELGDSMSKTRLYFMYNPEIITRDYVSYLEQSALDPFNTVYQSGNLVAPPSIMNFSFELFFDRQEEAMSANHPGVFVDYQFFDMVVRNVAPDPSTLTGTAMPDNGVMMVNPRDITVIFSPQLSVQGRPTNAQVTFEKFTHRMTPTRMRIRLTILASYFGPVKDMVEYKAEELPAEDSIAFDDIKGTTYSFTFADVEESANGGTDSISYEEQMGQANDANHKIRQAALNWTYTSNNLVSSKLVTSAYKAVGHDKTMGWDNDPGVSKINSTTKKETSVYRELESFNWKEDLLDGDILISGGGAIAFFARYSSDGEGLIVVVASPNATATQGGEVRAKGPGTFPYSHLLRPTPLGYLGSAAQSGSHNTGTSSPGPGNTAGTLTRAQTVDAVTGQGNNIRLAPEALTAWNNWRAAWGGPIPCTSGWRDPVQQQAQYEKEPNRFAPANKSYHCKGLAVDVDNNWLNALSAADKTKLRNAARGAGWGQARWRQSVGVTAGYECPCNWANGAKADEPWHFSWGGCG